MRHRKLFWRGWNEPELACYQQDQGSTNHCAKFASASALNLLYGRDIPGDSLVAWVAARPWKGTGVYTIWGNHNGSLVYQTANLLRKLAQLEEISPEIRCRRVNPTSLIDLLQEENTLGLVTLTYLQGKEPRIFKGENNTPALAPASWIGGHVMILAAYDPGHLNRGGLGTPWGFLSSWGARDQLYWMNEDDFLNSWGRLSLFNTVLVTKPAG